MQPLSISENLTKHRINFQITGKELVTWCPSCKKVDAIGNQLATFHINQETDTGQCYECLTKFNLQELTEKLSIKSESEKVADKVSKIESYPAPRIWTVDEILSTDFGNEEWLIKDLIPFPSITALSGNPGNYKTWFTMTLAQSIAEGKPFLKQFPTHQGAVLIVDEENHSKTIKNRILTLNMPQQLPIYYLSQEGIKIDNRQNFEFLMEVIKEKNVALVILDSLIRIHNQEENDAKQMALVMGQFQQFMKSGVSVLFTHHHRKQAAFGPNNPSQSLRGSSDILAAVDCHLTIKKISEDTLLIQQEKLRQAPTLPSFNVTIKKQEGVIHFEYAGMHDNKKTKIEEAKEAILQLLEEESQLFREDFHERIKIAGKQNIDLAIKELEKTSAIESVPKEELTPEDRKKNCYRLVQSPSQLPTTIYNQENGKEKDNH